MASTGWRVLFLLQTAKNRLPHSHRQISRALHRCSQGVIPETAEWFKQELANLASGNGASPWGDLDAHGILAAAIVQVPASDARYRMLWEQLLTHPRYRAVSIHALNQALTPTQMELELL